MAIRPQDRDSLYTKLREVLGADQAKTLMGLLPPERDQLATQADIDGLGERMASLGERMASLAKRMDRVEERLWDFHEALRAQTRIFVTTTVSAMFGVAGFAFGAALLL